jgi:hypothetical protein
MNLHHANQWQILRPNSLDQASGNEKHFNFSSDFAFSHVPNAFYKQVSNHEVFENDLNFSIIKCLNKLQSIKKYKC